MMVREREREMVSGRGSPRFPPPRSAHSRSGPVGNLAAGPPRQRHGGNSWTGGAEPRHVTVPVPLPSFLPHARWQGSIPPQLRTEIRVQREGEGGRESLVGWWAEVVSMMAAMDAAAAGVGGGGGEEEARVRKPYTITKLRESWSDPEHDKFLEALHMFDRDWRKIEAFVGSKTVIQIRSHAQKYFLKVQKNGTGEHLPPPRPKRKAAHPYPHKASKKAAQELLPQQASHIIDQGCVIPLDASTVATNSSANDTFPSCDYVITQCSTPRLPEDFAAANICSSSIESQSGNWPTSDAVEQEIILPALHAMPDFARVYNFLGSMFDPETSGHLQKLREMDPIDAETVLLLMKNLSINLSSPNSEAHRRLLSSHGDSMDQVKHESIGDLGSTHTLHLPVMVKSK